MSAAADPDSLAPLLARNAEHRETLLSRAGSALSAEETAEMLGIAPETVDERRRVGILLAVPEGGDCAIPPANSWRARSSQA